MTSGNVILPHTPPDSPLEDTDSETPCQYDSDTEALAEDDWDCSIAVLDSRARKLEVKLQEVGCKCKASSKRLKDKAPKIKADMQDIDLERRAVCVSCDEHDKYGSSRCRARKARKSAKIHARFPTGEDGALQAVRSEERKDLNPSLDSPAVNLPVPQNEPVHAKEKIYSNLVPAQIQTEAAGQPTLSAQQPNGRIPATDDTLGSNKSAKRGLPSTTNCYEPAQEPRIEKRRKLTSKELKKRRGISEDPVPL